MNPCLVKPGNDVEIKCSKGIIFGPFRKHIVLFVQKR